MSAAPARIDPDWAEALSRALVCGRGRDDLLVFRERREDLTVVLDGATGCLTSTHGSASGVSASLLGEGRSCYAGEASPDSVASLVLALQGIGAGPQNPPIAAHRPPEPGLSGASVANLLASLAGRVRALRPGARLVARWVGADQEVLVARVGRAVEADVRRARRIRLEVEIDRGHSVTMASGDAVLPLDERAAQEVAAELADEVVARAEQRFDAVRIAPGEHQAVLAPGVGGVLVHEIVGHALEADVVLAGLSWLSHLDPGQTIAPRGLTAVDDPRRGRAAWQVDDEGERARPTPLLLGGRVAGWLHDLHSAKQCGSTSTGHGRRASYRDSVRPRMGCTFVAAGSLDPGEVLEGIERGIYIRAMESAHADARSGRAVFHVADADLIERGRPTRPVLPHLVSIEARKTLGSIDRIANDLTFDRCVGSCIRDGQPLATSVGGPTMRIGLLTVMS